MVFFNVFLGGRFHQVRPVPVPDGFLFPPAPSTSPPNPPPFFFFKKKEEVLPFLRKADGSLSPRTKVPVFLQLCQNIQIQLKKERHRQQSQKEGHGSNVSPRVHPHQRIKDDTSRK